MYQYLHMRAGITKRSSCNYLLPDALLSGVTAVPMNVTVFRQSQLLSMLDWLALTTKLGSVIPVTVRCWSCVARMWWEFQVDLNANKLGRLSGSECDAYFESKSSATQITKHEL
jgi:hypothetical protein